MTTPQKIGASNRWKLIKAATTFLATISKANGYNTSPLVTRDNRTVKSAEAKHIILVEDGAESKVDARNCDLELVVSGFCKVEPYEDPIMLRNMLLQDIRTALEGDRGAWRDSAGIGAAISLDRCEVDGGLFLDEGWATFEQTVRLTYPQGPVW